MKLTADVWAKDEQVQLFGVFPGDRRNVRIAFGADSWLPPRTRRDRFRARLQYVDKIRFRTAPMENLMVWTASAPGIQRGQCSSVTQPAPPAVNHGVSRTSTRSTKKIPP